MPEVNVYRSQQEQIELEIKKKHTQTKLGISFQCGFWEVKFKEENFYALLHYAIIKIKWRVSH